MRKINKNKKVVVAMSGGVDSSAAAILLKDSGFWVTGMFMRLGIAGEDNSEAAVRAVCRRLKIDFYPVNLEEQFNKEVKEYFINSYKKGLTPNPCVRCNQLIKFGELLARARALGADCLATGHYVRSIKGEEPPASDAGYPASDAGGSGCPKSEVVNKYELFRGKDKDKDQSYFLYTLTQAQLKRIIFPMGEYTKEEARALADKAGLPYIQGESQDVCFLKRDGKILEHNQYLKKHIKLKPGPIKLLTSPHPSPSQGEGAIFKNKQDRSVPFLFEGEGTMVNNLREKQVPPPCEGGGQGEVIGEHQGLPFYTIGQRRGIEIGGTGPYYVAGADYRTNTLYVVNSHDHPALFKSELIAQDVNWISGQAPELPLKCEAVIRYGHKPAECEVKASDKPPRGPAGLSEAYRCYTVKFKKPQRAVTPGQSVVFYSGDKVLGGGIIKKRTIPNCGTS